VKTFLGKYKTNLVSDIIFFKKYWKSLEVINAVCNKRGKTI